MHHVIKTQVIEVYIGKELDAFELQHAISSFFYNIILPEIEKMFDELSDDDKIMRLEKLEIDLGNFSVAELKEPGGSVSVKEKIAKQLKDILNLQKELINKESISYSVCLQWLYYMKNGRLPWNTLHTTTEWYDQVLEGFASDHRSIGLLRSLINTDTKAVRRIVSLHSTVYLSHLAEVLTAQNQSVLHNQIGSIYKILKDTEKDQTGLHVNKVKKGWEKILQVLARPGQPLSGPEIIENCILPDLTNEELTILKNVITEKSDIQSIIPMIRKRMELNLIPKKDQVAKSDTPDKKTTRIKDQIDEEGVFVSHAGIVLLHPFFKPLFSNLGLLGPVTFRDHTVHQKGLLLLNYLSTGTMEFEEHELVIDKILCGYPIEDPVDTPPWLSDAEKDECDALLSSVIGQWTILKNTSPGGLRENFLKRPGKLFIKNDSPQLLVESNSIDVLLDHLPWGINIIKLPWMEEILKVDWR